MCIRNWISDICNRILDTWNLCLVYWDSSTYSRCLQLFLDNCNNFKISEIQLKIYETDINTRYLLDIWNSWLNVKMSFHTSIHRQRFPSLSPFVDRHSIRRLFKRKGWHMQFCQGLVFTRVGRVVLRVTPPSLRPSPRTAIRKLMKSLLTFGDECTSMMTYGRSSDIVCVTLKSIWKYCLTLGIKLSKTNHILTLEYN